MIAPETCVLLFVKSPVPGKVKTRLGRTIGDDQAACLYRCFGLDIVANLQQIQIQPLIWFAPAPAESVVRDWLGTSYTYRPQISGNLGQRMAHAFEWAFAQGYRRALIFGSDSPDLPTAYVEQALGALMANQIVIGPSEDGGYYTLGFTADNYYAPVFSEVAWSTESVYATTRQILQRQSYSVVALPPWYDIDTLADLQRLYRDNLSTRPHLHSLAYLIQHQDVLFN